MNDLSYAANPLGLPADNHGSVAHTHNASTVGNDGVTATGDLDTNTFGTQPVAANVTGAITELT